MSVQSTMPSPTDEAQAHSERVAARLHEAIARDGGWLSFARFMEIALYAPGLGYYSAGARKLGPDGDFITAPELSPLFGRTLARQVQQVVAAGPSEVLELGAGSGALAASLLQELERLEALPERYLILELSADLRERSRDMIAARVPHLMERVAWLNQLPPGFTGLAFGNEVLDAMPVHLVEMREGAIMELGVVSGAQAAFEFSPRPASGELLAAAQALQLPEGYRTEIGLVARAFMRSLAQCLERGVVLFLDYGFPAREYYHPERREGTLMCHYRHRAHPDPLRQPGIQDITSHVDFSAMAKAAQEEGMELAGYTSQAQFLVNCGITELMQDVPAENAAAYLPLANQANRLLSPAEMGELFKAVAFARDWPEPLIGFRNGDRSGRL
jgi:SAM-dependent MidA family methyltransferase